MGKAIVDIAKIDQEMIKLISELSTDAKRVMAKELQNMAIFEFPQAVASFYPSGQTHLKVRTGRLRMSFEGFSEDRGGGWWRVGMRSRNVEYARIQHDGGKTAPHTILPRNKKALSWEGAKHPVRRVNHPGSTIRPAKFFEKPMKKEVDPMIKRIRDDIGFRR